MLFSSPVKQFYRKKSLFITGATGFLGKVLLEKLIRECEDIGNIYVLIRAKLGKSAQERLNELLNSIVFASCRGKHQNVIAVNGDISLPGLGISSEDRQKLIKEVSVVFHSAASVKFHGPLNEFIAQNVRGTESVMNLCKEMGQLEAVVYVSTAYANCCLEEIEEKIYPLSGKAEDLIKKITEIENLTAGALTNKLLEGRPNSYTFSKALAENLVEQNYADIPVTIVRPSIVTPSMNEPLPGWVDNMNGVAGALLLGALGIARTMDVNCDIKADLIPVDLVCNALITIGWYTATFKNERKKVIHVTSGTLNPITWGKFLDYSRDAATKAPSIKMVRPLAKNNPTSARGQLGRLHHQMIKMFSHLLFAYFVDMILVLLGYKKLLVKVTHRMHRAFSVLEHFTGKEWKFHNRNLIHVYQKLNPIDSQTFYCDIKSIDWKLYAEHLYMGTRRYLLNEDDSNIPKARERLRLVKLGYAVFKLILLAICWFLFLSPLVRFFHFSINNVIA